MEKRRSNPRLKKRKPGQRKGQVLCGHGWEVVPVPFSEQEAKRAVVKDWRIWGVVKGRADEALPVGDLGE